MTKLACQLSGKLLSKLTSINSKVEPSASAPCGQVSSSPWNPSLYDTKSTNWPKSSINVTVSPLFNNDEPLWGRLPG